MLILQYQPEIIKPLDMVEEVWSFHSLIQLHRRSGHVESMALSVLPGSARVLERPLHIQSVIPRLPVEVECNERRSEPVLEMARLAVVYRLGTEIVR